MTLNDSMNRREFIAGAGSVILASGCRSAAFFGRPDLVFGVISDVHITTQASVADLRKALKYFKRRGVDAVMSPGDLTDWGTKMSLKYFKRTWDEVFGGTDVVALFCTGNHEYEGYRYGDMALEMRANGVSESEALTKLGFEKTWREVMGEDLLPINVKSVKGYDFVSAEWGAQDGLGVWMEENGHRFANGKPFFFFQHAPIKGTTTDSGRSGTNTKEILSKYPNCIAFTGHTHQVFHDEGLFWKGEFTVVATPSLSYASLPGGENTVGRRDGTLEHVMQPIPSRRDLCGDQGFVVNVWRDKVVIERIDLEEEASDCRDWVLPLTEAARRESQSCKSPAPKFSKGAIVATQTMNTENRMGKWVIAMNLEFPTPTTDCNCRVKFYEVRAIPFDGSDCQMVRRFVSPAYHYMRKYEPIKQRFWFDVNDLPQDKSFYLQVRAINTFGVWSQPIRSEELFMLPPKKTNP